MNSIPRVREGIFDTLYAQAKRHIDLTPDLQLLEKLKVDNPELFKNIGMYINYIDDVSETYTQDETYRIMMACVVSSLKGINAELEVRELENENN